MSWSDVSASEQNIILKLIRNNNHDGEHTTII
jgi:hypothetical protein